MLRRSLAYVALLVTVAPGYAKAPVSELKANVRSTIANVESGVQRHGLFEPLY